LYKFSRMQKFKTFWYHLLFWIVFTGIFIVIEAGHKGDYYGAFLSEMMNLPLRLFVVYLNYFFLLPDKLLKGKVYQYIIYTVGSLIVFGFFQRGINYFVLDYIYPDIADAGFWLPYKFLNASVALGAPLIFLIGISLISYFSELQRKNEQLKSEKLQAELDFLKSQVNPHFLFNTLNNLYGLALEQSKKVPELILKLSDLLSYSLYESDMTYVTLSKEIEMLENYISIEEERYEGRADVEFNYDNSEVNGEIPPLLLMTLVENAFKHGVKEEIEFSKISIDLKIDTQKILLKVTNTMPEIETPKQGIGLKNLRKRLDILYNNEYELSATRRGELFVAELKIPIS
ncbi:MAG: histidine kinase, partial [Candidatus Paceibacterota bacterium]